jgi:hypothetical protein
MQNNQIQFPSLDNETRNCIPTNIAAFHLGRRPQTLRAWACLESGPLRPMRINGRLAWPVAAIRELLGGAE